MNDRVATGGSADDAAHFVATAREGTLKQRAVAAKAPRQQFLPTTYASDRHRTSDPPAFARAT